MILLRDLIYKNGSNKFGRIRMDARKVTSKRIQKCEKCSYNKHVEACHIKEISSFPLDTPVNIINSESNLILLCPNCHWELDYEAKKIENSKKYICQCGRKKCKYSYKCNKCSNKEKAFKRRVVKRPSKEELSKLINNYPYTKIGEMYGVSDNAIKKWCKFYKIKLSNRLGYWSNLRKMVGLERVERSTPFL